MRQKLFFQPLSVVVTSGERSFSDSKQDDDNVEDNQVLDSPPLDIREGAAEQCEEEMGTNSEAALWGEMMSLQESNNTLKRDLEVFKHVVGLLVCFNYIIFYEQLKEYDIAQKRSKESSLLSLVDSHERLIQQLRDQLTNKESQLSASQKSNQEIISRLTYEEEGQCTSSVDYNNHASTNVN